MKWEQGDLDVCIHVNSLILVDVLQYENITFHFIQTNIIAPFRKFLHDKFAMTTIVVLVIGVQGEIDGQFALTIANGEVSDDIHCKLQSILLHFFWKEIKFLFVHLNHG